MKFENITADEAREIAKKSYKNKIISDMENASLNATNFLLEIFEAIETAANNNQYYVSVKINLNNINQITIIGTYLRVICKFNTEVDYYNNVINIKWYNKGQY